MFFELTVTVTQIANNWKEMNELTVTATQKISTTVTNCNSKDLQLSYSFLIFLFHNCNFNSNSKENCKSILFTKTAFRTLKHYKFQHRCPAPQH